MSREGGRLVSGVRALRVIGEDDVAGLRTLTVVEARTSDGGFGEGSS